MIPFALTLVIYAQSCAVLACQSHLKKEEMLYFTEELIRLKDDPDHNGKSLFICVPRLFTMMRRIPSMIPGLTS